MAKCCRSNELAGSVLAAYNSSKLQREYLSTSGVAFQSERGTGPRREAHPTFPPLPHARSPWLPEVVRLWQVRLSYHAALLSVVAPEEPQFVPGAPAYSQAL